MNPYLRRLRIVCGHRGKYPAEKIWPFGESIPVSAVPGVLEALTVWSRSGERRLPKWQRFQPGEATARDGGTVVFRCPICGCNPRYSQRDWHAICEAWRDDGRDTLDISTLR